MPSPVITELGYLETPYLTDPYGSQRDNYAYGFQVDFVRAHKTGMQVTFIAYNITQLRILCDFSSRGTPDLGGDNWTASNQAAGDFLPANLNTDVEEEVFRSAATSVDLICDSGVPQGVTIDTLAIRNHNLTTEALVQLQGSKDDFATVDVTIDLTPERVHMYYIAPIYPSTTADKNRKWKFVIQDPDNPDGYIQIGAILFGNARIFSPKENWVNPIRRGSKHFKDVLPTEGFTNAMSDRARKKWLTLTFEDLERFNGNFRIIEDYLEESRTDLKCLVIPKPSAPSRYAVFAKLVDEPAIEEKDNSDLTDVDGQAVYCSLALTWDESL